MTEEETHFSTLNELCWNNRAIWPDELATAAKWALAEIAAILRRQDGVEVCIKEKDKSASQETEQNTLDELQKLVAKDGLLIWRFPESGGMIVRLKRYEELNDDNEQKGGNEK